MKKALLIGINYVGTGHELGGCWNDVKNASAFLGGRGYTITQMMTDEPHNKGTHNEPTCANIRRALAVFASDASAGDKLFFHYSGHGGSVRDRGGDESDRLDECIYPCDGGQIIDDDLYTLLCASLPQGVTLFAVLDCCHSGSGLDLPWRYLPGGRKIKESKNTLSADVFSISGCKDDQTSGDLGIGGVLTINLLKILRRGTNNMRWQDLIQVLQYETRGYAQIPQLSVSSLGLCKGQVQI